MNSSYVSDDLQQNQKWLMMSLTHGIRSVFPVFFAMSVSFLLRFLAPCHTSYEWMMLGCFSPDKKENSVKSLLGINFFGFVKKPLKLIAPSLIGRFGTCGHMRNFLNNMTEKWMRCYSSFICRGILS